MQRRIGLGLGECALEMPSVVVEPHVSALGQQQPSTSAQRAARDRLELGRQQLPQAVRLTGALEVGPEREQALWQFGGIVRREAQRVLAQLDRFGSRAARARTCRRGSDRGRKPGVGIPPGEGEVVRAQRLVGHRLGEDQMEPAALARPRALLRRRCEQRVRGAHTPSVDEQQPGIGGLLHDIHADNRRQLVGAQLCAQRHCQQQPAQLRGEPAHARAEELLDAIRHRDVLSRPRHPPLAQRPANLEDEQRIPERRDHDATQHLPGQHQPEPIRQQPPRRAETEPTDLQSLKPPRLERTLDRRRTPGTPRQQQPHRHTLEPTDREHQRVRGRSIEPREVIDSDHKRLVGGQDAKRVQHTKRNRVRLPRPRRRLGPQQRYLQRRSLRSRHARQRSHVDPFEQIDQRSERQPRLRSAGPSQQHPQSALTRKLDPRLPQRRLPHPRLTGEHQSAIARTVPREIPQHGKLRLAPDHAGKRRAGPIQHATHSPRPWRRGKRVPSAAPMLQI